MSVLDIKIILNIFTVISLKCPKYLIENREKFFEEEILYNAVYYIESINHKNYIESANRSSVFMGFFILVSQYMSCYCFTS